MSEQPVLPAYADPDVHYRVTDLGAVHFIGIGGAGMSGIARIMLELGVPVSGSDAKDSATLRELAALGARVRVGHDAEALGDAQTVVASSAIRPSNPEIVAATERGLRIIPRAQALAAVTTGKLPVAVAGTHGKTSTTSMLVAAIDACAGDPSYAIGGDLRATGTNSHLGSGEVFALEADESDGSFLLFGPHAAIVTNIEADHLDNYGDLGTVLAAFDRFIVTIRDGGFLVACADDPHAAALAHTARSRGIAVHTYGRDEHADLRLREIVVEPSATSYRAEYRGRELAVRLDAPGEHMALNSAAVLLTGIELGYDPTCLAAGLATFGGVARRMDPKGTAGGVRVFDDYAHHPTEVRAQLSAARQVAGDGRLVVCFQPHLYSRTKTFATEFAEALGLADEVVVMDVYAAREDPDPTVTGALIADQVPRPARARFVPEWDQAAPALAELAAPGDLVMTVGAGDVTEVGPLLVELLERRDG